MWYDSLVKKIVHTATGSRYLIDYDNQTWERYKTGDESGELRSDGGQFIDISPLEIGKSLAMMCPPYHEKADGRAIITSAVLSIEDVPVC